jgi:polysaccharide biosynthesis protein PslH
MKILLVSSYLPYPLTNGGNIRLFNLIKELSKKHEITLLCELRINQTVADVDAVKSMCKDVMTFPRKKQWRLANITTTALSAFPFLMVGHTQQQMKETIAKIYDRYDLIHIETFYVYQNVPNVTIPTVLVEHNIEYHVYERFLKNLPVSLLFLRPFLFFDIQKMKYWEQRFWKHASKLVAVSQTDKKDMQRSDTIVVPNGVDIQAYRYVPKRPQKGVVLFIGDFSWVQNRDAVSWIITTIFPKLPDSTTLWIVGKKIPQELKKLSDSPRIIFDEHAPKQTAEIYAQADVLLAPIRVGGGTSYKILESMASGVPVVTTELGAVGIGAEHDKHMWIGNSEASLAEGVTTFLTKQVYRERITKQARLLIEQAFSWSEISKQLEAAYREAVQTS